MMPRLRPLSWLRSSLPAKLGIVAAVFCLAVGTVRVLTLDRLAHVDATSGEVRHRWMDSIRLLGTLRHDIAGVRIEEAEILFGRFTTGTEVSSALQQRLATVSGVVERYRSIPHDPDETAGADAFVSAWSSHVQGARAFESLVGSGRMDGAVALFEDSGRASFQRADGDLRDLIDLTEAKAQAARKTASEAITQAQNFVSDLILASLVLFAALAVYLWRSFSRPLLELARLMRRLAAYDAAFTIGMQKRRDEIGEMARALAVFRRNTVELLESRKSLSMQTKILADALDRQRALAAEQSNFIRTMSHEFRTPLGSIDGNAQRLIATRDRITPDQVADRAHRIRMAVFRMISLVVSLTSAMEVTSDRKHSAGRRFDLSAKLRDLASYYRETGVDIVLNEQIDDHIEMCGDAELLHSAFSNLLSNALKYSPQGGVVTLRARARHGGCEVVVEDHGLGIPPDEVERVRERYYRGSNVGSIPGTGIGLHLVDQIIAQHGGRLRIESELDGGSRMIVWLPLQTACLLPKENAIEHDLLRRG
jgi:signal transduction histidine kinase